MKPSDLSHKLSEIPKFEKNSTIKLTNDEESMNKKLHELSSYKIYLSNESKTEFKASEQLANDDAKPPSQRRVEEEKYHTFRYSSDPDEFYEISDKNESDAQTVLKQSILS